MPLDSGRVTAVLGPTNTGKTHFAIERMLAHRTGVIGLPLRLLAREVYDRVVEVRGPSVVALVTGEERIVPPRAAYWVCTVEAMPVGMGCDFLAVDEIQVCADADRGYIFTDRLLSARGLHETLFLGAETMRGRIASLVPGVEFMRRERMSKLTYSGARKISRMPPRSAIVAFSVDNVYAIAELLRRQKGGAAVVMGALSPRTRNAQVELYQNGDVDHLVATDAIGMGLNLDIRHIAFAGTAKFDGRRHRDLQPNELAQIAGRAGRFMQDGTFGVTGEAAPFDDGLVNAIEEHRFAPIRRLQWRNSRLEFGTVAALMASLEAPSTHEELVRGRDADDLITLKALAERPQIRDRVRGGPDVRALWDVCQLPDFRKVSPAEHASLVEQIFDFVHDGVIPDDWLAKRIAHIDKTAGDIDTLSKRLAFIRTWTYVAQRSGWVCDSEHWRAETRAVEDRLSDALHQALTQRFVDRRTSVLMRRLKQKEVLVADVNDKGEVRIEDQFVGRLAGFRFQLDPSADPEQAKTLRAAALAALQPAFSLRADVFYNAPDTEIDFTEQGGLMWGEHAIGKFVKGADPLSPGIEVFVDEGAGADVSEKLRRRLTHWFDRKRTALFAPLIALRDDPEVTGLARGIAFRLVEQMGVLPRNGVAQDVKSLDQDQRKLLRKHGVRFGQFTLFQPLMLKPAPTRLRLVLWSLFEGFDEFPESPPPGLVTVPGATDAPAGYYQYAGYRLSGDRAIRIDMLERLADMIRSLDTRGGFEATADMLSITGLTLEQFANLLQGMGYAAEKGEREKQRPAPVPDKTPAAAAEAVPSPEAAAEVPPVGDAPTSDETPLTAPEPAQGEPEPSEAIEASEPTPEVAEPAAAEETDQAAMAEASDTIEPDPSPPADSQASDATPEDAASAEATAPDTPLEAAPAVTEVFYTFTWAPRRRDAGPRRDQAARSGGDEDGGQRNAPRRGQKGGPRGGAKGAPDAASGKKGRKGPPAKRKPETISASPPKTRQREVEIDPDNPFAALLALKSKT